MSDIIRNTSDIFQNISDIFFLCSERGIKNRNTVFNFPHPKQTFFKTYFLHRVSAVCMSFATCGMY